MKLYNSDMVHAEQTNHHLPSTEQAIQSKGMYFYQVFERHANRSEVVLCALYPNKSNWARLIYIQTIKSST